MKTFSAFAPASHVDGIQGAVCVEIWNDKAFVGLSDGYLCTLSAAVESGSPLAAGQWQVQARRAVASRPVTQLVAASSRSMLLALADEGINAFSLPTLMLKCQAARTKGATSFSWDDATDLLCSVNKRRLLVHRYDGLEFVEQREVSLPEAATSVQSVGSTVYVGLQASFVAVDAATGVLSPLLTGTPPLAALARCGGRVLLTCGQQTLVMAEQGRRTGRSYTWGAAPLATASCPPYVLALSAQGVEVQMLDPFADSCLGQVVALSGMASMAARCASDGSVFVVATTGDLVRLAPLPRKVQAQELLALQEHEEALAMASLMPAGEASARRDLEDQIQLDYGRHLLGAGKFEEAMQAFSMSRASTPAHVLRSFPFLLPPHLLSTSVDEPGSSDSLEHLSVAERVQAVTTLTPYLLSYRSRLLAAEGASAGQPSAAAEAPPGGLAPMAVLVDTALLYALLLLPDSGALLKFFERPNCVDFAAGEAALQRAGRYAELVALYRSRDRHESALDMLQTLSASPEELPSPPQGAAVELKGMPGVWAAVKYLTSMDSPDFQLVSAHSKWILQGDPEAGLEMFEQMQPPLAASVVLPILTSYMPDVAETYLESALESGAAEREIYEQELAMLHLQRLTSPGLAETVQRSCAEKLKQLILSSQHLDCTALLRLLPANILEIRAALLERLERHVEALRIFVHQLRNAEMAEKYCDRVYARRRAAAQLLRTGASGGLNAGDMVSPVTSEDGASQAGGDSDIYIMLIKVLLEEQDGSGGYNVVQRAPDDRRWEQVAGLLGRKNQAVHPLQALQLLPGEVPISLCVQFLEAAVWAASEHRRRAAMAKNLRRAEHVGTVSMFTSAKQRTITVTVERACCICHKRLSPAATVAFPDGMLAHFSCHRRYTSLT